MAETPTPNQVLLTGLDPNPSGADTIGQFLSRLNRQLFEQSSNFKGGAPFGQMGWGDCLVQALIHNKYIEGAIDEWGQVDSYNVKQFKDLMTSVFDFLDKADYSTLALPPEPSDWYLLEFDSHGGLVDSEEYGYTKEEAEDMVNTYNSGTKGNVWKAIHIPK